jgi:hypothetical protein
MRSLMSFRPATRFARAALCGSSLALALGFSTAVVSAQGLSGSDELKPLPAPHNNLPPVPALPGAQFPGGPPNPTAGKPVPQDRESLLTELYAHLAKAPDTTQAAPIAETIEKL